MDLTIIHGEIKSDQHRLRAVGFDEAETDSDTDDYFCIGLLVHQVEPCQKLIDLRVAMHEGKDGHIEVLRLGRTAERELDILLHHEVG